MSTAAIKEANKIMLTVIEKVIAALTLPVITVKALFPAIAMVSWLIMD